MWDLLLRALEHPFDYLSARKVHTLNMQSKKDEGNGTYSFSFTCDEVLNWHPGQHGVFYFGKLQFFKKNWRAFSIASAPFENIIMIGTIIPETPSDFKKKLLAMQPGDTITMRGPFGEFKTNEKTKKIVGIAGGIGITPFRSILAAISQGVITNMQIELIYAGKNSYFAFQDECQRYCNNPDISITYVNSVEEVNAAIDEAATRNKNNASYFVSGSPGMIGAVRTRLSGLGIKKIINDPFKGY